MADTQSVGTKLDAIVAAGADGTLIALMKRLTTDLAAFVAATSTMPVEGEVADGTVLTGVKPVLIAGQDATAIQSMLVDTSGRTVIGVGGSNVSTDTTAVDATMLTNAGVSRPLFIHASLFDGTNYTRWRQSPGGSTITGAVGVPAVGPVMRSSAGNFTALHSSQAAGDGTDGQAFFDTGMRRWNGTTYDRSRNNVETQVVSRVLQATTYTGSDRANYNGRGVTGFLNVTANPGGAQTLTFTLEVKDELGGDAYVAVATSGAVLAAGGLGLFMIQCYPGDAVTATVAIANVYTQVLKLPRTYRWIVTHSGAGNWSYTVADCVDL